MLRKILFAVKVELHMARTSETEKRSSVAGKA